MPFDKDNAAAHGSKGGGNRWKDKNPGTIRSKMFSIKVTPAEYDTITEKAAAAGLSRVELIIRAVEAYKGGKAK